jgi:hypothetical protein
MGVGKFFFVAYVNVYPITAMRTKKTTESPIRIAGIKWKWIRAYKINEVLLTKR